MCFFAMYMNQSSSVPIEVFRICQCVVCHEVHVTCLVYLVTLVG